MKYHYHIGGITIASDIYYPEMVMCDKEADVLLAYGDVPGHLDDNRVDYPVVEANETQYLLKLPNIGRYLVENGNKITIQAEKNASPDDVRKYVLTNVLGALSYQRGFIPMHGGIVMCKGKAILISGKSGMGKSALLAALYLKGCKIVSDDISNLKIVDGQLVAYPTFPRLMLWKDLRNKLGLAFQPGDKLRTDMEKYLYPIQESFVTDIVELSKVCILTTAIPPGEITEVKGFSKIIDLKNNLFNPWITEVLNKQRYYSQQMLAVAGMAGAVMLGNDQTITLNDMADLFIEKIGHAE